MVTLTCVSKLKDGYAIKNITVKSMDAVEIAKAFDKQVSGWGFNTTDFEIFKYDVKIKTWVVVAQHTGRGWVHVSTFVKNWDKIAVPSFVKKVKSNSWYKE